MSKNGFDLTGVVLRGKKTGITYTATAGACGGTTVTIGTDDPRADICARLDYEEFCAVLDEMIALKAEAEKLDAEVCGDE